jgi:hypothetical protein
MSVCKCNKSCRLRLWEEELRRGGEWSLGAPAAIAALKPICDELLRKKRINAELGGKP